MCFEEMSYQGDIEIVGGRLAVCEEAAGLDLRCAVKADRNASAQHRTMSYREPACHLSLQLQSREILMLPILFRCAVHV